MSVKFDFDEAMLKLEEECRKKCLNVVFKRSNFPLVFHITPFWEDAAQVRMKGIEEDRPHISPDASISLIYAGEMVIQTSKLVLIEDKTLSKIKGLAKKACDLFLLMFFENRINIEHGVYESHAGESADKED